MINLYQKLAIFAAGTALGFTALEVNLAQATTKLPSQTAEVSQIQSFNNTVENLQQQRIATLDTTESTPVPNTAKKYTFSTYYLTTTTNSTGYFSVAHGLSSRYGIYGLHVAVQHKNGNWHTLEFSSTVDNRFWWNSTYVQGVIASSNFYNRPVRILLHVYP